MSSRSFIFNYIINIQLYHSSINIYSIALIIYCVLPGGSVHCTPCSVACCYAPYVNAFGIVQFVLYGIVRKGTVNNVETFLFCSLTVCTLHQHAERVRVQCKLSATVMHSTYNVL